MIDHLVEVDVLLRDGGPECRGWWPKACVWLLRIELEEALRGFWARTLPEVAESPARIQLLLLNSGVPKSVARQARAAWANLSRAGHCHAYELAPTVAELRSWHDEVAQIRRLLAEPE